MIPATISFKKTTACRTEEYQNLLGDVDTPCSEIKATWAAIFHDMVKPQVGWQALWIVSEENCGKFSLLYPSVVIVKVEQYDWDELAAFVSVTAVQDDIVLPETLSVPLVELHAIRDQDYNIDDLNVIADWLDKVRFFFKYLWYPWDGKVNIKLNEWCDSHLKNRLQIQSDIQNGLIDMNVCQYYKSLLDESRKIDDILSSLSSKTLSKSQRVDVISNCLRRKILKLELDFFEEPSLRDDLLILRNRRKGLKLPVSEKEAKLVWRGGGVDALLSNVALAKSNILDGTSFNISSTLDEALESSSKGNIILLPQGAHRMKSLSGLESGGDIVGLSVPEDTTIISDDLGTKKAILFECYGDFNIKNLTILRAEGIAVQLFEKTLKISNCRLESKGSSVTKGIVVVSGCELIMEDCEIFGFGVGIVLQKGASATLRKTRIHDCYGGVKLTDDSRASFVDVVISHCSEYAILMESLSDDIHSPKSGELDLISSRNKSDVKLNFQSVILKENKKCNVMIDRSMDDITALIYDGNVSKETIVISDVDFDESM